MREYGGAMLADPVGTGKTYIALAVAAAIDRRPAICFVPAGLTEQWRTVAGRLGVPAIIWSHERVSRGALPGRGGLVVVDESHHFRNPTIRRYRHLAPWLVGRPALLLSAAPVVNRLGDLGQQLALTIRDDALRRHGVPSLAALLGSGRGHAALGHVVLVRDSSAARRPAARERIIHLEDDTLAPLSSALALVDRLRLSTRPPIAALVRSVLWRAGASSAAALAASVDRYRRLLLHARDAARADRVPERSALKRLTGDLDDQLLFWELLDGREAAGGAGTAELALEDLPALDELWALSARAAGAADPKLDRLCQVLADERPTLVFAGARATVRHLRERLGGRVAWCTGEQAGIGHQTAHRTAVLDWFRPRSPGRTGPGGLAPCHLIATDVVAEGLDLHRAERVVHYDLPWTPARMEQREGRARRLGASHATVEIIRFEPPPAVEARLRQLACLAGKRSLPALAGLDEAGRGLWRWRGDLADRFSSLPVAEGVALLRSPPPGILAGFTLHSWPAGPNPLASFVLWWTGEAGWTDDPDVVTARLDAAAVDGSREPRPALAAGVPRPAIVTEEAGPTPSAAAIADAIARLAEPVRHAMGRLRGAHWVGGPAPSARRLVARLHALARLAGRRRDAVTLDRLHRAIRFAAGGHTAGELALIARLASLSDGRIEDALTALPSPTPEPDAIHARLTGIILFEPG